MSGQFKDGLCDCNNDKGVCCWICCCPGAIFFAQTRALQKATGEDFNRAIWLMVCLGANGAALNRGKIRKALSIPGGFVNDCCIWCFCAYCAACQEYRTVFREELDNLKH